MAFHIRDRDTDTLVREYARRRSVGVTAAVKLAVTAAPAREHDEVQARLARIKAVREELAQRPNIGPPVDRAVHDALSDEEDRCSSTRRRSSPS